MLRVKEKEKPGRYGVRKPAAGLAKIGTITFNPAAYELMGEPQYLEMTYGDGTLWFRPTTDPGQHEVKVNRTGVQYRINSRRFIREYAIPPSNGSPYEIEQNGEWFCMKVA